MSVIMSTSTNVKYIPKDAQVIMAILKELGINDFDPRVINQLLEFIYCELTFVFSYFYFKLFIRLLSKVLK